MNATEQLLNELQLIKQTTFNSQASLADMTAKMESEVRHRQMLVESHLRQRQMKETTDETDKTKDALAQMYADKLKVTIQEKGKIAQPLSGVVCILYIQQLVVG